MNQDEYKEREYELIEEIENSLENLDSKLKILKRAVNRTICELEVEDFLMNGPGGKDPN